MVSQWCRSEIPPIALLCHLENETTYDYNLKGDLTTRAQAMLNINMGTPEGLSELAGKLESELSAIKDKVLDVVVIPPELYTLRDALAELAALPFASLAAAAKIVSHKINLF